MARDTSVTRAEREARERVEAMVTQNLSPGEKEGLARTLRIMLHSVEG